MKVGMLTGGGDCPGLNPVIRGIVTKGIKQYGDTMLGLLDGWKGLLEANSIPLNLADVENIIDKGGTIIGTSRTNVAKVENGFQKAKDAFKKLGLDALIAIGGEDTLGVANKLAKDGLNIVACPKTIDNDLSATDFTFGFDTSVNIIMESIDRIRTTAESHHRVIVVEIMGRHAGWLALWGGMAGGADVILIPEETFDTNSVCEILKKKRATGKKYGIVAVAEGALPKDAADFVTKDKTIDSFGHVKLGGIGAALAKEIEKRTGFETREVVLGHLQRGGTPTAFDRVLGTRFGVAAIDLVHQKKFGYMVSLQGNKIVPVALEAAVAKLKTVDPELFEVAKVFF